ncbi:dTDP-4-dehydrorhamnose 3,5-epimerase [Collimonas sp.]|jgi:dTDP-4-dehydrorhamnose 3,5-epimerase|uniref:dTDP-4-dehydrorhamnose 3,5-epimerase n=1 Tax=Collimonas sp. TaxID=1963772 RepID=UPI002BD3F23E|nr:dTDP-4-dehydrorhamnose 3,5-epimerase [Collimonas sp.]HWX00141.1 dTDP-4-dehydrorhamnose 3,5-epimerase [Collimonas sp.]
MKIVPTSLPDVLIIQPKVLSDLRGTLWESFNERQFSEITGLQPRFVQDNHTISIKGVLRGLHYQLCQPQGKLVRVVAGKVFDVAVDIRKHSPNFGKWTGAILSAENKLQMWIPEGFAHGFFVLSESAEFLYKVTDYYAPYCEQAIYWNDPTIGIAWPNVDAPLLSEKDSAAKLLKDAEVFI